MFWKILILFLILLLALILSVPQKQNLKYGVTFSQKFSEELVGPPAGGWRQNYLAILDDLKIKDLRLVAYWDLIEPEERRFNFEDLDWQIAEAQKRGAKIILAMGRKTPRWPECHEPEWVKSQNLKPETYNAKLLNYIEKVVTRYKLHDSVLAWQVENEPYFPFGDCKIVPPAVLNAEIGLVRSLDPRPIILTDAGEIGFAWPYLAVKSDIFGTTLYRYVQNRFFGDIKYSLIPAAYFRLKAGWAKLWGREIIISELQAEPWGNGQMNPKIFKEIIDYAERSGIPKAYLWGVEWWYWMKEKQNKPEMWEAAKALLANSRE